MITSGASRGNLLLLSFNSEHTVGHIEHAVMSIAKPKQNHIIKPLRQLNIVGIPLCCFFSVHLKYISFQKAIAILIILKNWQNLYIFSHIAYATNQKMHYNQRFVLVVQKLRTLTYFTFSIT